jgi:phosphinothricin acetyltransferase
MNGIGIRHATQTDLPAINAIYNHYVLTSTSTYQELPETPGDRLEWFKAHDPEKHPVIVATLGDAVIGWGSLSPFHRRAAYRHTVENSIYVSPNHLRRGAGRALLDDLIARARVAGHHSILALIDTEQVASIALHEAAGFEQAAFLREVGFKFDRWLHVRYLQLML